jgi:hypothetical protein
MTISAILNYRVKDAVAYKYSCRDPNRYVYNLGLEVMRRVASMFPYKTKDDSPSLMSDGKTIGACMTELL